MSGSQTETARALFQTERQREILSQTIRDGRVDVTELASAFNVTTETIRRDLSELQNLGHVRRVHGGAVPSDSDGFEPLLAVRNDLHVAEKRRIAKAGIDELPPDGSTVIVDSGSTLTRFCEAIPRHRELTVVTNSLLGAQALAGHEHVDVVVLGGALQRNTLAMVDAETVAAVQGLVVDTLFISCDAMSVKNGLTTPYRAEAALKQAMISAADRVVAMADHSKVGNDQLMRFARWSDVDVLIVDSGVDDRTVSQITELGPVVRKA